MHKTMCCEMWFAHIIQRLSGDGSHLEARFELAMFFLHMEGLALALGVL